MPLHSSNCCRCRTIMIEPRDASLLFTFRGLGMFMPSKYLHKLLQRQRQRQQGRQQQQQQLPATIAAAFAIEPSLPALPIVTSGQNTASAKAMSAARDCRSERSSTDPPSDPPTDPPTDSRHNHRFFHSLCFILRFTSTSNVDFY